MKNKPDFKYFQLISDIHLEFRDKLGWKKFVDELPNDEVEYLIIAGDMCHYAAIETVLKAFAEKYPHVIYVAGNHCSWGTSFKDMALLREKINKENENIHWLECDSVELDGRTFHGATLWFERNYDTDMYWNSWVDFSRIKEAYNPDSKIYEEGLNAKKYLSENVKEGDIVITHMLPHEVCVAPMWQGAFTNCFFVHDCEEIILDKKPAHWVFGHTHSSVEAKIGDTQLRCNPYGYHGHASNPDFNPYCLIKV